MAKLVKYTPVIMLHYVRPYISSLLAVEILYLTVPEEVTVMLYDPPGKYLSFLPIANKKLEPPVLQMQGNEFHQHTK